MSGCYLGDTAHKGTQRAQGLDIAGVAWIVSTLVSAELAEFDNFNANQLQNWGTDFLLRGKGAYLVNPQISPTGSSESIPNLESQASEHES